MNGFFLGAVGHPVQFFYPGFVGVAHILHHLLIAGLSFGIEVFFYKQLPQFFTYSSFFGIQCPTPARVLLLGTTNDLGVKIEISVSKRLAEVIAKCSYQVKRHIVFQRLHICAGNGFV